MDPQLHALTLQLGEQLANSAIRNSAVSVADRITTAKTRKRDQETIAELEEIIYGLLSDKNELLQIAQAYEQELVAQRISKDDINYISTNLIPVIKELAESANEGQGDASVRETVDRIQPLLSVQTVTVLQLLGFNFRKAIGEPLTELLRQLILSRVPASSAQLLEIQRLTLAIASDPDAFARLERMTSSQ